MRKTIPLLLIAALVLTSGGRVRDSRINPLNWFGRAEAREVTPSETNPLIPRRSAISLRPDRPDERTPVAQITEMTVDRLPGGAIVRVTGVPSRQGAYNVGLKAVDGPEGPDDVLRYVLVADQPVRPVGTAASRQVVAAVRVSDQDLATIKRIEVLSASNILTSRR